MDVFEIDFWFEDFRISNVLVVNNEENDEILLGRNLLNKLVLLLDGPHAQTDLYETRPKLRL